MSPVPIAVAISVASASTIPIPVTVPIPSAIAVAIAISIARIIEKLAGCQAARRVVVVVRSRDRAGGLLVERPRE